MTTAATPASRADEATLAQAFARHDPWAFDEVYRRYGALLYSVALNVLHNAQDAEDCVHDVLVRIWKNVRAYSIQLGTPRAFLVVCVRNEAISRVRSLARRERLTERAAQETESSEDLQIVDFLEQQRVREALSMIPESQRKAVMLAYFAGKTHVEIAKELDEPLGTVKSRIALGLRKLGMLLSERSAP